MLRFSEGLLISKNRIYRLDKLENEWKLSVLRRGVVVVASVELLVRDVSLSAF